MALLRRVLLAATTGYILCFFSELYFFNEGPAHTGAAAAASDPAELFAFVAEMTLYYGAWAFILLWTIDRFRVRSVWALFLAGAVFGWLTEGTIVPVIYEAVPGTIAWPSLGWHALVDVLLGWYGIRLLLRRNNPWLTLAATVPLGLFWGVWSTWFWRSDYADRTPPIDPASFALFSSVFGLLCVAAFALQTRFAGREFRPTNWEGGVVVAWILFCFGVVVVPSYLLLSAMLPALLGVSYLALARNQKWERRENVIATLDGPVDLVNYAILGLMCPLASTSYALMYYNGLRWPLAETLCPLLTLVATGMFVASLVITTTRGRSSPALAPAGE